MFACGHKLGDKKTLHKNLPNQFTFNSNDLQDGGGDGVDWGLMSLHLSSKRVWINHQSECQKAASFARRGKTREERKKKEFNNNVPSSDKQFEWSIN